MAGSSVHNSPEFRANSARIVRANKTMATYYAYTVAGVIAFFAVMHFARLYHNHHHQRTRGRWSYLAAAPFRKLRVYLVRKVPKFSSGGHLLVVLAYVAGNAAFTFYDIEWTTLGSQQRNYSFFAKRCGWLCITNLGLALLLAMKNSPLGFLTGYSHERLNVLHRWTGRGTVVFACLHVVPYTVTLCQAKSYRKLLELEQIYGFVAFGAFLLLAASSLQCIRKRFYEWFFAAHILLFFTAIIFTGLHKPQKYAAAILGVAIIYAVDRCIRTLRRAYLSWNQTATLHPLPGLATRVVFKHPVTCTPGSHAFITLPRISPTQSHPFTIASPDTLEFVVKAQHGFTMDLHKLAIAHPGISLRAWVDGPYGATPDFKNKDLVVLFAGGSGAAFLFPVALDLARHAGRCRTRRVDAIWAIRDRRHLAWYEREIAELQQSALVNLTVHLTAASDSLTTSLPLRTELRREDEVRRSLRPAEPVQEHGRQGLSLAQMAAVLKETDWAALPDVEALPAAPWVPDRRASVIDETSRVAVRVREGRPDVRAVVRGMVDGADEGDLVLVGACGPDVLMRVARDAVAASVKVGGASVGLHCEQFGWG